MSSLCFFIASHISQTGPCRSLQPRTSSRCRPPKSLQEKPIPPSQKSKLTENIFGNIYPTQQNQWKIHPLNTLSQFQLGQEVSWSLTPYLTHHFTSHIPCTGALDSGAPMSPHSGVIRAKQGGILLLTIAAPPPNPTWLKQARFWFPCHISVSTAEWYIGLPTLTQQKQWMLWLPCPGVISRSRSMLSLHPTWQQRLNEPMISGAHHHSASYPHSSVNGAQKRTGIKR